MNTLHFKLITFDLDDTLWDMRPVLVRAEQRVKEWADQRCPELYKRYSRDQLMALRNAVLTAHPELKYQISQIRIEVIRQALIDCGYGHSVAEQLSREGFEVFIEARHEVELFNDTEDCLRELAADYTLGVLTNGNADIHRIGLGHFFSFAFSAEQLDCAKPAPDMFEAALKAGRACAAEMIHVGDHIDHDISGAQNIGAATIWINAKSEVWTTSNEPDAQVRHIGEVPGAVRELERFHRG